MNLTTNYLSVLHLFIIIILLVFKKKLFDKVKRSYGK